MVQSDELLLTVGASAHALGAAQQDTHLTTSDFTKQIFLLYLALGVVDEGDLVFGNAQFQQFRANIIINTECAVILRCAEVAKIICVEHWSAVRCQISNTFSAHLAALLPGSLGSMGLTSR